VSKNRDRRPRHHHSPPGRIDATPPPDRLPSKKLKRRRSDSRASGGRRPLTPRERRLIAALRVILAQKGISHSEASRIAGLDKGDTCRVLAGGEATPRTLRKLFETFKIHEYKKLSAAVKRGALLLEIHAAAERQAELLGELAALCVAGDPPAL
jgi:hypothetical protein